MVAGVRGARLRTNPGRAICSSLSKADLGRTVRLPRRCLPEPAFDIEAERCAVCGPDLVSTWKRVNEPHLVPGRAARITRIADHGRARRVAVALYVHAHIAATKGRVNRGVSKGRPIPIGRRPELVGAAAWAGSARRVRVLPRNEIGRLDDIVYGPGPDAHGAGAWEVADGEPPRNLPTDDASMSLSTSARIGADERFAGSGACRVGLRSASRRSSRRQ